MKHLFQVVVIFVVYCWNLLFARDEGSEVTYGRS